MSLWKKSLKRLLKNKLAVFGMLLVLIISALALCAPWIADAMGKDFKKTYLELAYFGPYWALDEIDVEDLEDMELADSYDALMGTDNLGRDLCVRVLYGARISLQVGLVATIVSIFIGVLYGAISGYAGGKIDSFMMRIVDVLYGLPYMFFVILIMVLYGRSMTMMFVALGAISWLTLARIVRGEVLTLRERAFIEASRALGTPFMKIIFWHIIPNVLGIVIVYSTLTVPRVILLESFLSFLGLGVEEFPSLGRLLKDGASYAAMTDYWWLLAFPGATMVLTLFGLNCFGDGLRDALDPKQVN